MPNRDWPTTRQGWWPTRPPRPHACCLISRAGRESGRAARPHAAHSPDYSHSLGSQYGTTPKETAQIARRRPQVAELYVKGWFQTAIGQELGISQPTVSQDLEAIRRQWRESSVRDFDAVRERELRKLDLLEREAWAAWQRSQQPAESTRVTQDGSGRVAQKTVQQQIGDPRYLEQIQKCIAARRALLGLDAPTRIAPVMPDGQEPFRLAVAHLSLSELRALRRLQDRTLTITAEQEHEADESSEDPDARVD